MKDSRPLLKKEIHLDGDDFDIFLNGRRILSIELRENDLNLVIPRFDLRIPLSVDHRSGSFYVKTKIRR